MAPGRLQVCSGALSVGRGKRNKPWAGVEAVAARKLHHPGIVRTLKHTSIILQVQDLPQHCCTLTKEVGAALSWCWWCQHFLFVTLVRIVSHHV